MHGSMHSAARAGIGRKRRAHSPERGAWQMLEEKHAQLSSKHSHTHSVTRERVLPAVQVRPIEAGKERMTADLVDTAISAMYKWEFRKDIVASFFAIIWDVDGRNRIAAPEHFYPTLSSMHLHPILLFGSLWHNCLIKSTASGIVLNDGPNVISSLWTRTNISEILLATNGVQPQSISYIRSVLHE